MTNKIEEYSLNAWPSLQNLKYDGWVLRKASGFTKRSNSVNILAESKLEIKNKIRKCERFYSKYHLPTIFKLVENESILELDQILEASNHEKIDTTFVKILDNFPNYETKYVVTVSFDFNEEWISAALKLQDISVNYIETYRKILNNITLDLITAHVKIENQIVGIGFGVIEEESIGLFYIYVKPELRKKGIASDIIKTILNESKKFKVINSYLQVVLKNNIAMNLYNKFGFKDKYKYWYRIKCIK